MSAATRLLPVDDDVDVRAERAISSLADLFARDVVAVAWSGGKDSTCALVLALMALRRAVGRGDIVCPLLVMNGDTEIENPAVRAIADDQIEQLREWAEREGLPVRVTVYRPALNSTWAVKVVGGMALPRYAGTGTRDCSVDWKVEPGGRAMRRLLPGLREEVAAALSATQGSRPEVPEAQSPLFSVAAEVPAGPQTEEDVASGEAARLAEVLGRLNRTKFPVVVLGSRREESAHRAESMDRHGQVADQVAENRDDAGKIVSRTFSPIADWEEADVWELIGYAGTDRPFYPVWMPSEGFQETVTLYRDAAGGACVAVPGAGKPARTACGARTGCWNCQAVGEDRSLNQMIEDPRHAHLSRLVEIRDFVAAIRHDWGRRTWLARGLHKETRNLRIGPDTFDDTTLEAIALATMSADRAEALRADRFDTMLGQGRTPDAPYLRACADSGETPNAGWVRRMQNRQFQTYTPKHIISLDFYWSLYGRFARPFHALSLAHRVWTEEEDFRLPTIEKVEATPLPANRWRPLRYAPEDFTGVGDPLAVALEEWINNGEGRPVGDTVIPDFRMGADFDVDEEAAALILDLEYPNVLQEKHDNPVGSVTQGASYYLRMGAVRLSPQGLQAVHRIMQRTQALEWSGFVGKTREELLQNTTPLPVARPFDNQFGVLPARELASGAPKIHQIIPASEVVSPAPLGQQLTMDALFGPAPR